ncbi:hypothetical protein IMSAGC007_03073 [Lachnospiraceae bacterium]|jgi:GT2 family glycosyltransferase|uniref:glycosyltransferase family 2 protein n=1 Tax=Candidatus Merdisoma sp. JLR.KK011 TaxID=3114299 RepID=UPI00143446FC|nr:glycosyltransferase family 2 protein [Lachnospiraceae bacterium]GFI10604.1 hypothetical protein IMSAGC007_03073 [Lachnospiraceae bacterium]
MKKSVLAIFTCFNRKEITISSIKSLIEENAEMDLCFIAVDDKSTDGTAEELEHLEDVTVVQGTGSLYYTGGMREGMKYAKQQKAEYDYVLLFNDDVAFYPHALEKLAEELSPDEKRVLVGAVCGRDGRLSYGGAKKKSRFRPSFEVIMAKGKRKRCDTFNANCVLIPWKVFLEAPIMDGHYRHSLGDFAYGLTLGEMGCEIEVVDFFVGLCDDNPADGTWRDPKIPRKKRIQMKEMPKGLPAKEWFYFVKTYFGTASACVYTILPYVKIMLGRPT